MRNIRFIGPWLLVGGGPKQRAHNFHRRYPRNAKTILRARVSTTSTRTIKISRKRSFPKREPEFRESHKGTS